MRTGAPADAERRGEAGARGVGTKGEGEGGAPAELAARRERGGRTEGAGKERLWIKDEREGGGESNN